MKKTATIFVFVLLEIVLIAAVPDIPKYSNVRAQSSPNKSTSCAYAQAPPFQRGTLMFPGAANLACGGRSDSEIDTAVLSHCPDCRIVQHFTHACASYSETAGNNKNNVATGFAVVSNPGDDPYAMQKEAANRADEDCAAHGGVQCYVRLSACDVGNYSSKPSSGSRTAH